MSDARQRFRRLTRAALGDARWELQVFTDEDDTAVAGWQSLGDASGVYVVADPLDLEQVAQWVRRRLMRGETSLDLILVTDVPRVESQVEEWQFVLETSTRIQFHVWRSDGLHVMGRRSDTVDRWLKQAATLPDSPVSPEETSQARRRAREVHAQEQNFQATIVSRRPRAAHALIALCTAVMLLEVRWGSLTSDDALAAAGALLSDRVRSEPWRLLSAGLLHGGILHLLVNGIALAQLGGLFERFFGAARLLILITLAIVGGTLASSLRHAGVSVGISGGIAGLIGALLVVTFRSRGQIPAPIAVRLRRALVFVTVLNAVASLQPAVDGLGHLGGFATGLVVGVAGVATGWLWRGLSRDVQTKRSPLVTPTRAAAVLCVSALVASLGLAWAVGQPWDVADATPGVWMP